MCTCGLDTTPHLCLFGDRIGGEDPICETSLLLSYWTDR